MCLEWLSDISKNITKVEKIEVSALAYTDDTTWVAASKESLQSIINISNEFFELNDIEINRAKSELIVWRPNTKAKTKDGIWIGTPPEYVEAKKVSESTRFLGVWINPKCQEKASIGRCKKVVGSITSILKMKKLSVNQVVYINNMILLLKLEYILANIIINKKRYDSIY